MESMSIGDLAFCSFCIMYHKYIMHYIEISGAAIDELFEFTEDGNALSVSN